MASSARRTRPPSIGKAGSRLNAARKTFAHRSWSRNRPPPRRSLTRGREPLPQLQHTEQDRGQGDVDRGPGQGDQQLLSRLVGHPLQPCHAADRQQRDVAGADPEPPRGQGMPQFVQDHDAEQGGDGQQPVDRVAPLVPRQVAAERHPAEQEEECKMDMDVNTEYSSDAPGASHRCCPLLVSRGLRVQFGSRFGRGIRHAGPGPDAPLQLASHGPPRPPGRMGDEGEWIVPRTLDHHDAPG